MISPFSLIRVFVVYKDTIMVSFSKTRTLKPVLKISLFQAPKTPSSCKWMGKTHIKIVACKRPLSQSNIIAHLWATHSGGVLPMSELPFFLINQFSEWISDSLTKKRMTCFVPESRLSVFLNKSFEWVIE